MAQKAASLSQTAFPLYTIHMVGDTCFLVAGGGGSARTGVANAFEIYELKDDQGTCVANQLRHFEAVDAAIMNSAVTSTTSDDSYTLATGQDGCCKLYTLRKKIVALKPQEQGFSSVRKRKSNLTNSESYKNAVKTLTFDIDQQKAIQTDYSKEGGYQKCVLFSHSQKILITGGSDGYIRVWKHPGCEKMFEIESHSKEIDDLDISPDDQRICSVSKDCKGCIWEMTDGKKKTELQWMNNSNTKYRMRSCRFGKVEDKAGEYKLFTTHIPVVRGTKAVNCYMTKWNTTLYRPEKVVSTGTEVSSALAVSSDGNYIGIGTLSGSISVYISFSLQKLYYMKEAHGIFVTGVEFAPSTKETKAVTGNHDFTLFSISADNHIKIHQEAPRAMYSPLWAILGCIILIYLAFWFISMF